MVGVRMLELCNKRRSWPVLLALLLPVVEFSEEEAEMEEPLKKEVVFTVEFMWRGRK